MFKTLTDDKEALGFYVLVLVFVFVVALMPNATTEVAIFAPLAATLFMLFAVTRDGYTRQGLKALGVHHLGLRAWPLAILGPVLVLGIAYGVVWITGLAGFAVPELLRQESARLGVPVWLLMGAGMIIVPMFTLGLVTSFGEELGWRGYLLPRLKSLGPWRAVLLTGLLHGLFHLPIMLLTTLYHAEGNRLVVVPLFLMSLTAVGMFLGYLRLRTDSVWPAVIAHSAHNVMWSVFGAFTATSSTFATEYLAGESGILPLVGYAVLGGWLMLTLTRRGATVRLRAGAVGR